MKTSTACLILALAAPLAADEGNPQIDFGKFAELTANAGAEREKRRISEDKFLEMAAEEGTVILDTRSKAKFDRLHVKGAIHLNFSDFADETLAELIPDKTTRILIYCNNNFEGVGAAMITKSAPLALNIPTFLNLWGYGYRNIYELRPFLDIKKTRIPFEGSDVLNRETE
ncbi:rhodanese-like domain-containing protein [Haloferula sp. A504]|uniref:rhodanese-like domain-containing protein n=1 Tax=Haloferula sp. A504 TaxID=3373601 RepID=UPI0031CB2A48|nr:rhodanese-like domain-containing protein [Verrucomicrobiaceae bacterium E54]